MANNMYDNIINVNGLRGTTSNVIDNNIELPPQPITANAILVIGTAEKGPLYTPVRLTDRIQAQRIFGNEIDDVYFNTDIMKGYREIKSALPGPGEIIGVRIGDASPAKLDLYEHMLYTSGDLAYLPDTDSQFAPCMTITSKLEGDSELAGNRTLVNIYKDATTEEPTEIEINVEPTNTVMSYTLDVQGTSSSPTVYSRVTALAQQINADLGSYLTASVNLRLHTSDVPIVSGSISGDITRIYDLGADNGTHGDKIVDIVRAYKEDGYEDANSIRAGNVTAVLDKYPKKDADELTKTITTFRAKYTNSEEATVTPAMVGGNSFTLVGANLSLSPQPKLGDSDSIRNVVIRKNVNSVISTVSASDYTAGTDGVITFTSNFDTSDVGTIFYADYDVKTQYREANVRSLLEKGSTDSYFIIGNQIIFGAGQKTDVIAQYDSDTQYVVGSDIVLADTSPRRLAKIEFVNSANLPSEGDTIKVEFVYEPELPAPNQPSGATVANGNVQGNQLTGGSNGRAMDAAELYAAVQKGMLAADNTACKYVVIEGAYMDSTGLAYNAETGLPEQRPLGYETLLSTFLKRKSMYVSECEGFIGIKPIAGGSAGIPSIEVKEAWYDRLVNFSSTDTTRPANIIDGVDDYHLDCVVGDLIMTSTGAGGTGRTHVAYAPNIYAAMRYQHNNLSSMINKQVRSTAVPSLVYAVTAMDRIAAINAKRYTLITQETSASGGSRLIIADAPSLARPSSKFRRQYNVAIAFEAINAVRTVLKPFISQPNTSAVRQAMDSVARIELQKLTPHKLIGFDVSVTTTYAEAIDGNCIVDLEITTAVEIMKIKIQTRLQLSFT